MSKLQMLALLMFGFVVFGQTASAAYEPSARTKAAAHKSAPHLEVGIGDDAVKAQDFATALVNMSRIKDAGANSVRITVKEWQHDTQMSIYDRKGVCNAARAAEQLGVQLVVTTIGDSGNPPFLADQYDEFNSFEQDIVDTINGRGEAMQALQAQGITACASSTTNIILEPWNEPNMGTFMSNKFQVRQPDGYREAARLYEGMLEHLYPFIKSYGTAVGDKITVWGCSVASPNDPVNFIREIGRGMKAHHYRGLLMDACTYHPYESASNVAPGTKGGRGFASYPNILNAVQTYLCRCPVIYSEVGWETSPPPGMDTMYGPDPEASTVHLATEAQQAQFMCDALQLTAEQGVSGVFFFPFYDDKQRNGGWQSGLYYPLWKGINPKTSLAIVAPCLRQWSGQSSVPSSRP